MSGVFTCSEKALKMQICIGNAKYCLTRFCPSAFKRSNIWNYSQRFLVASLYRTCVAVGVSGRYVGAACGCSDMKGGTLKSLKNRFGSPARQDERTSKNSNSASHMKLQLIWCGERFDMRLPEIKQHSRLQEITVCLETESRHSSSSKRDSRNQLGEISSLVIHIRSILYASLFILLR